MIIKKFENVKSISKKIENYENQLNIVGLICPCCKCKELINYGYYERNVVYLENDKIKEKIINIKRVLCKNCNSTHAIIPDFIIPYKIYSLNTILVVVEADENNSITTVEVADRFEISRQLILKWKKQFNSYLNTLSTMYEIFAYEELLKKVINDEDIIRKYYFNYKELLLLQRRSNFYCYIPT